MPSSRSPEGDVEVWLAEPESWLAAAGPGALEAILDDADRADVARLRAARARDERMTARGLLRLALAHHAGVPPGALAFARPRGRPQVVGPPAARAWHVSVSHTRGLAACALARAQVGVDVEWLARPLEPVALARRFFAPEEARALCALPAVARAERFLSLWTAKEAFVKARGEGIAFGLARVRVEGVEGEGEPRLCLAADVGESGSDWSLHLLRPSEAHGLAVVVRSTGPEARRVRLHWPPPPSPPARSGG